MQTVPLTVPAAPPAIAAPLTCLGAALALHEVPHGRACLVRAVQAPADAPEWARWLAEIGFEPGETVSIAARGPFGGDPLAVRVGSSTFALRCAEAACVQVELLAC